MQLKITRYWITRLWGSYYYSYYRYYYYCYYYYCYCYYYYCYCYYYYYYYYLPGNYVVLWVNVFGITASRIKRIVTAYRYTTKILYSI